MKIFLYIFPQQFNNQSKTNNNTLNKYELVQIYLI